MSQASFRSASIAMLAIAVAACTAQTDGGESRAQTSAALEVGLSSVPKPVAPWAGTVVDLLAADAWAQCGAHVGGSAAYASDPYLAYLESKITQSACSAAVPVQLPVSSFNINNCGAGGTGVCTPMKSWARQRQVALCNVNASTGQSDVVHFYDNSKAGHTLAASLFTGLASPSLIAAAIPNAQRQVDIADVNLCMAQRLRERVASADSLFLGAAELRQLLEVTRERAQVAMVHHALLARAFSNPNDPAGGPAYPSQALILLKHWSKQTAAADQLRTLGDDLATSVQLHVDATRELAELLVRSASARTQRGGTPANTAEEDFGAGSWRQRLLALLYGGQPLASAIKTGEVDLGEGNAREQLLKMRAVWQGQWVQESVPWDTLWMGDQRDLWPNQFPPFSPAMRYATTKVSDPHVYDLLGLARSADALYLKELNADYSGPSLYYDTFTVAATFRRIDPASSSRVWALVEAWLRTQECRKTNPSCVIGVNGLGMPSPATYSKSLLWKKYGITPTHAESLVSMLADALPLQNEVTPAKLVDPSAAAFVFEVTGAQHVTGASRPVTPLELGSRLPGETGVWYRVDPKFTVSPVGLPERAPVFTSKHPYFLPRSLDRDVVPTLQGFGGYVGYVTEIGAISALTAARELLERSANDASAALSASYLAKLPRALATIDGAIGERSVSVRPSVQRVEITNECWEYGGGTGPCPNLVQTLSAGATKLGWDITLRTAASDAFFGSGPVSLVAVPFAGGIESAAALDPNYTSLKGKTRANLLGSPLAEVTFATATPAGTNGVERLVHVDLPREGIFGGLPAFSLFLKRTVDGQAQYQLLMQRLSMRAQFCSTDIVNGASTFNCRPSDGQFVSYGGVLGQTATRAWVTRGSDWSKPAYDGFGMPIDWVPPFDSSLSGGAPGEDAVALYLRNARAAAEEATSAVKNAVDELLQEEGDQATLKAAQRRASEIGKLEQRALCGDVNPDCDTSSSDLWLYESSMHAGYIPHYACTGSLCSAFEDMRRRTARPVVSIAKAVYDRRHDTAPPPFREYAGGMLQSALIKQWSALRGLKQVIDDIFSGLVAQQAQVAAAQQEMNQVHDVMLLECSDETMRNAFIAGFSQNLEEDAWRKNITPDVWDFPEGDLVGWSPGALYAQKKACEMALTTTTPSVYRWAAVVDQSWAWMASQTTRALEAGAALQAASAEVAITLQKARLTKASAQLEASLAGDALKTKFDTYRRYHSYDVWRARALLESTRRYAVAARRAIEAQYVVDLSEIRSDEPFVAAPATWADEIYEYDLSAPTSVGLTAIRGEGDGIYPNRLVDYVGNLQRFVNGYSIARPTAVAQNDDEVFHLPGPDARVTIGAGATSQQALSGDVTAWEFLCPDTGKWVRHPGLTPATPNVPIAALCGGLTPTRARSSFSLDPWGRLYGGAAMAPQSKRHNARWRELAVNLVGTGVRDCARATSPSECYSNPYIRYDLTHVGPASVTGFDEQWRSLGVPVGRVVGAKALAAEQLLDPTGNGFAKPYVANVARSEFSGRPLGGAYQLEIEVTPDVRLDRIEQVQVLSRTNYWVKQGYAEEPREPVPPPPAISVVDYHVFDVAGGTVLRLYGSNLGDVNAVVIDPGGPNERWCPIVSVTQMSVEFVAPAVPAGSYGILVKSDDRSSNTLTGSDGVEAFALNGLAWTGAYDVAPMSDATMPQLGYDGIAWPPTVSAGTSGTAGSLTDGAASRPSLGVAVNGFRPVAFNGMNQKLTGPAASTFVNSTASTVLVLAKVMSAPANGFYPHENPFLVGTQTTSHLILGVNSEGFRGSYNTSPVGGSFPATTPNTLPFMQTVWHMFMLRWGSGSMDQGVDGIVLSASVGVGPAASGLASNLRLGVNSDGTKYVNAEILNVRTIGSKLDNATIAKVEAVLRSRYRL